MSESQTNGRITAWHSTTLEANVNNDIHQLRQFLESSDLTQAALVTLFNASLRHSDYERMHLILSFMQGDEMKNEREKLLINFSPNDWRRITVKRLATFVLQQGLSLNVVDSSPTSTSSSTLSCSLPPLMAAIKVNRPDLVQWMLHEGKADPLFVTGPHYSSLSRDKKIIIMNALQWAASLGRVECTNALLPFFVEHNLLNARCESGFTALHRAVSSLENSSGRLECAKLLLQAGADVDARDACGRTALHHVLCPNMARLLVQKYGANLEAKDFKEGRTPLHFCVLMRGRLRLVQCLVQLGANLFTADTLGRTLIHTTLTEPSAETAGHYLNYFVTQTIPQCIVAQLDVRSANGRTPLHEIICQIRNNDLSRLELALSFGPDIEQTCRQYGWTALHYATQMGHRRAFKLLSRQQEQQQGASATTIRDFKGRTPLHLACLSVEFISVKGRAGHANDFDFASWLLQHGHEVAPGDWQGLIHRLAQEAGIDIRPSRDGEKMNLLNKRRVYHWGESSLAKKLVQQCGADLTTADKDGNLPFFLSAIMGQVDTTFIMIQAGAHQGLFENLKS